MKHLWSAGIKEDIVTLFNKNRNSELKKRNNMVLFWVAGNKQYTFIHSEEATNLTQQFTIQDIV